MTTPQPYPAYKPSGVPWLGDVPTHWDVRRVKFFYREVDERSASGSEELMSVSHKTGVTPRKQNVTMFLAESNVGYKVCRPGDIVVNTMWAYMAALGMARQEGLVSPSYGVYRPLRHGSLLPDYIDPLLRTEEYRTAYLARSTGITDSRLRLYPESFLGIPLLCPPLPEQQAIVRYLDHADRRIRRYVSAKRRLIALLEEEKQAVINQAVTRGLDPNVRLKPSGVEWLGDVPEHWEVRRLKQVAQIRYGLGQPPKESQGGLPLIRATNVTHGRIVGKDMVYVDPEDVPVGRNAFLAEREIIVVRSGAYTADSAIVPKVYDGAVTGYDMVVTVRKALPEFIALALLAPYVRDDQLIIASTRSAQPHLNAEELGTAGILLPPLPEQAAIVEYFDKATADIETAIDRARRQIELLEEYRTRLIADVVTGKLDVREAAGLPEEADDQDSAEGVQAGIPSPPGCS